MEATPLETDAVEPAPATHRRPTLRASAPTVDAPLPRFHSSPGDLGETQASDVIAQLALLADPSSILRLNHDFAGRLKLSPPEVALATLVDANFNMRKILEMSPLREDDTYQLLASLVTRRVVTVAKTAANR